MEIMLNDLSIDGQFDTLDEFADYFVNDLNPMLDVIVNKGIILDKKSDTFSRKVTPDKTLDDIRRMGNYTPGTVLKQRIIQMAYTSPYWDEEDIQTNQETVYIYPGKAKEPNCLTEAIERTCPLLSFPMDIFSSDKLECEKNGERLTLDNIIKMDNLLNTYLRYNVSDIKYIIENYPFKKKVELVEVSGKCYAQEALLSNALTLDDYKKILKNISNLIESKASGEKTHWWDNIDGDINEYRVSISSNREFRLFFVWGEKIYFLNGFIKKTQSTPDSEKKKAKSIWKQFKN